MTAPLDGARVTVIAAGRGNFLALLEEVAGGGVVVKGEVVAVQARLLAHFVALLGT